MNTDELVFKLTEDEVSAFEALRSSFEHSIEYIKDLLIDNKKGNANCSELYYVWADHVRGLSTIADHNTLYNSRNIIADCYKRYEEAGGYQ